MKKRAIIKITLKSPLCMGSGYSFANIVDSDVCFDSYGIPYIPSKRLKGCFKECAENVLSSIITKEQVKKIFGEACQSKSEGIVIGNAHIENYSDIVKELKYIQSKNKELISSKDILEKFTTIQAQTALNENGVAEENSLRFTRTVNRYSPVKDGEPMVMYSEIEYDDEYEKALIAIIKGTRNIGLKRNRGLGSVKCELCVEEKEVAKFKANTVEQDKEYVISYVLKNEEPLVLSNKSDGKSDRYISGSRILGCIAGKYLAMEGNSAEDEAFKDLFLRGVAKYTNAYPCDGENVYYPAPEYINMLKKTKKIVNLYGDEKSVSGDAYNKDNGNLPKKIKNKFVSFQIDKAKIKEVDMDIVCHHRHGDKDEQILYSMEVVKEGQEFAGEIMVPGKYVQMIGEMLSEGIRIGKSSSVQYGKCKLVKELEVATKEAKLKKVATSCKAGETVIVTFLSDGILVNDKAEYTVYKDEAEKVIARELELEYDPSNQTKEAFIKTKEISGYNAVWNLRRQSIPAIGAGTSFVFTLTKDCEIDKTFVGERCLEGYGQISVSKLSEQSYGMEDESKDKGKSKNIGDSKDVKIEASKGLVKDILVERIFDMICAKEKLAPFKISASELGRVTMMLNESLAENKDNYRKAFEEFVNRVESIKTVDVRNAVKEKVLVKVVKGGKSSQEIQFNGLSQYVDMDMNEVKWLKSIGCETKEWNEALDCLWGEYIKVLLTDKKYAMKCEEKKDK